jgi:hypothetical protein
LSSRTIAAWVKNVLDTEKNSWFPAYPTSNLNEDHIITGTTQPGFYVSKKEHYKGRYKFNTSRLWNMALFFTCCSSVQAQAAGFSGMFLNLVLTLS